MRRTWILSGVAVLAGCGYVGEPLPPALSIPERITDLDGVQRGGEIVLRFTPTLQSTDQLVLKTLRAIELRAGPKGEGEFELGRWVAGAEKFDLEFVPETRMEYRLEAKEWEGREIIVAVRGVGPTGRGGDWSNLLVLKVTKALPKPSGLTFKGDAKGVYLTWKSGPLPAGGRWRVWRRGEEETESTLLGLASDPSWLDTTAATGSKYSYWVQAMLPQGERQAESEPGEILSVVFRDEFPPATPRGLTAIAGLNGVELAWERNVEEDLAGYQVYRALEDGPLEKLGAPVALPAASDAGAVAGRRYRYAVAAVDTAGNTSKLGEAVEIVAPEKPRP